VLAPALHVTTLRDVSCSSATSTHFTNPQQGAVFGTNPARYNALSADTTLVTVGIGGNDIGLVGLAESCINVAFPLHPNVLSMQNAERVIYAVLQGH